MISDRQHDSAKSIYDGWDDDESTRLISFYIIVDVVDLRTLGPSAPQPPSPNPNPKGPPKKRKPRPASTMIVTMVCCYLDTKTTVTQRGTYLEDRYVSVNLTELTSL